MAKEQYVIKVNTVCPKCEYRNFIQQKLESRMNIIACGNCGYILNIPNEMEGEDVEIVREVINKALEESK